MIAAALTILGPLAAAGIILLLRRRAELVALGGAVVALGGALVTLVRVDGGDRFGASFAGLPGFPLRLAIVPLTALLSATVATVAVCVFAYATGYMAAEEDRPRFFAAMLFFVAAMQTLVLAGDWILFLAAWELIGLASYLLIGFWFERPGVAGAATRAFVTTRAADAGLYVGVFALIADAGTSEIAATLDVDGTPATVAGLAFLLAAAGKSAQVPLQGWLLDAMAGPTPVSALLHSATLVVAGVVLLGRASPLLPDGVLLVVGLTGGITAVVTGLMAVAQRDLKRLLAASTASQIGLMLLALGAGSVPAAILHLVANAAMKSSLFLAAGVFQHARDSTAFADLRGVGRERRGAFVAFAVAGLSLAGAPPLAGFWSKDVVIAATFASTDRTLLAPLALVATVLTGTYLARGVRLLWMPEGAQTSASTADGWAGRWMGAGLAGLSILAAGLGLAVEPIGRLLDAEIPERPTALVAGLLATGTGLLAGWILPSDRLLGLLSGPARRGFRFAGGTDGLVVGSVLALARIFERSDVAIHRTVLAIGRGALGAATGVGRVDGAIVATVAGVGRGAMETARAARMSDDAIDAVIFGLVDRTRRLGVSARRLQSGLVHRELLAAAAGTALLLAIVLLS